MYKEASSIASCDANVLVHVDKLQISTLAFQGKGQTGQSPKLEIGIGNVTPNTSQDNFAIAAFGIWFGQWRVLYRQSLLVQRPPVQQPTIIPTTTTTETISEVGIQKDSLVCIISSQYHRALTVE